LAKVYFIWTVVASSANSIWVQEMGTFDDGRSPRGELLGQSLTSSAMCGGPDKGCLIAETGGIHSGRELPVPAVD
jgi:hypothetical protein